MKVMNVAIRFYGGNQEPKKCEAIEHAGSLWLVCRWLENKGLGIAKPARIVLLDALEVSRELPQDLQGHLELVVLTPIPETLFDLSNAPSTLAPFSVVDHPDITVELASDRSNLH